MLHKLCSLVIVILIVFSYASAQKSDAYDYPIRPGTPEWKSLDNYDERLNAYNIPEGMLKDMSTKGLVESCLNYPEFRLIMTRNSLQHGYDYVASIFNGFRALEQRKGAGKELLKLYNQLDPANITKYNTRVERGKFAFRFTYIELLLAQEPILKNMDDADRAKLIRKCIKDYEVKEKMPDQYAAFGLSTPTLVLGRLLTVQEHPTLTQKVSGKENLNRFVESGNIYDRSTLSEIISMSKAQLNE